MSAAGLRGTVLGRRLVKVERRRRVGRVGLLRLLVGLRCIL